MAAAPQASTWPRAGASPGRGGFVTGAGSSAEVDRKRLAAHYAIVGTEAVPIGSSRASPSVLRIDGPRTAALRGRGQQAAVRVARRERRRQAVEGRAGGGPRVLGKLDRDEDEMIVLDEVMRSASP